MLGFLFLAGRVAFLALERVFLKRMGDGANPYATGFLFFAIGVFAIAPLAIFSSASSTAFLPYAIASGLLLALSEYYFINALSRSGVSRVGPVYNLNLAFLLVLAVPFAGDSLTLPKILGTTIAIFGASMLAGGFTLGKFDDAIKLTLASAFVFALVRVIDAYAFKQFSPAPLPYMLVMYFAAALAFLALLVMRKETTAIGSLLERKPATSLYAGLASALSYLCVLLALPTIEVTIIEPVASLSMPLAALIAQHQDGETPNWHAIAIVAIGTLLIFA